ncbi:phage tail protein [Lactiplantibacillus plantarum]|uniref:phage tail protein n=1 Tax=Lactiplantibacillus plantarum TaxID=1590 RepID=UPI003965D354
MVQAINSSSIDRLRSYLPESFTINWQLNGDYQLTFTAYNDSSPAFENLNVENSIQFDSTEYVIKQVTPDYSGGIETVNVTATHIYNETSRVFQRSVKKGDIGYLPNDVLDFFFKNNDLGFSYTVNGNFDKRKITDLGNISGKEALAKIVEVWPESIVYPEGKKIGVYTHDQFFKNYGHRIDYLNNASEISFDYDSTEIINQVRAVGPTYEKKTKVVTEEGNDSGNLSGTTTRVNGSWEAAIKYGAEVTNSKIDSGFVKQFLYIINRESRGQENAINNWDVNAQAGHPSKGIVQFIDNTFQNYAIKPYTNIYKGWDQILAVYNSSNYYNNIMSGWGNPSGSRRMDTLVSKPSSTGKGATKVIADAKKYIGVPYVWGGHNKSNPRAGMDCSGFVSQVYHDFGIEIPAYTVSMEKYGHQVNDIQTGDMLFYGPHGATHHVALALDSKTMIYEPQPGESCKVEPISYYPPSWYLRNDKMAAIVAGNSSGSSEKVSYQTSTENYFDPFIVQDDDSIKKWGLHPGGDVTSDSIKNAADMKAWVMTQLKPNPTLTVSIKKNISVAVLPGDIVRLEIRPNKFITNLAIVGYSYHPFSKVTTTTITLNQTAKTILDYEKSRYKNYQIAQQNGNTSSSLEEHGQETWTAEEVTQFGSRLKSNV